MEDIKSFEEKYKGSEEEAEDLKSAYLKYEGDMDHIMTEVRFGGRGRGGGREGNVTCEFRLCVREEVCLIKLMLVSVKILMN